MNSSLFSSEEMASPLKVVPLPHDTSKSNSPASRLRKNLHDTTQQRPELLASRSPHRALSTSAYSPAGIVKRMSNVSVARSPSQDWKENSSDTMKVSDRSNHGFKAAAQKKAWVSNFKKVSSEASPTRVSIGASPRKRILSERNEMGGVLITPPAKAAANRGDPQANENDFAGVLGSPSLVKAGVNRAEPQAIENLSIATPDSAAKELTRTVAEAPMEDSDQLEKRIQKFLEDQQTLFNTTSCDYDDGVPSASERTAGYGSSYHPIRSLFFDHPQFPVLLGTAGNVKDPAEESSVLRDLKDEDGKSGEGLQIEGSTRSWGTSGLPCSPIKLNTRIGNGDLEDKAQMSIKCSFSPTVIAKEEVGENIPMSIKCSEASDPIARADAEKKLEGLMLMEEIVNDGSHKEGFLDEDTIGVSVPASRLKAIDGFSEGGQLPEIFEDEIEEDEADVPRVTRLANALLSIILLATVVCVVLLASGSPGLLPSGLRHNALSSSWRSSKLHQPVVSISKAMDGLWDSQLTLSSYSPVDGLHLRKGLGNLMRKGERLILMITTASEFTCEVVRSHLKNIAVHVNNLWEMFLENMDWKGETFWAANDELERATEWDINDIEMMATIPEWEWIQGYDLETINEILMNPMAENQRAEIRRKLLLLSDSLYVHPLHLDKMALNSKNTEKALQDPPSPLQEIVEDMPKSTATAGVGENMVQELLTLEQQQEKSIEAERERVTGERILPAEIVVLETLALENEEVAIAEIEHEDGLREDGTGEDSDDFSVELASVEEDENIGDEIWQETNSDENVIRREASDELESIELHVETATIDAGEAAPDKALEITQQAQIEMPITMDDGGNSVHRFRQQFWSLNNIPLLAMTLVVAALTAFLVSLIPFMRTQNQAKLPNCGVEFLKRSLPSREKKNDDSYDIDRNLAHVFHHNLGAAPSAASIGAMQSDSDALMNVTEARNSELRATPVLSTEDAEFHSRTSTSDEISPSYGSFTTYKLVSMKEGQGSIDFINNQRKLTPVRRSNRIRYQTPMSPNDARRFIISPT